MKSEMSSIAFEDLRGGSMLAGLVVKALLVDLVSVFGSVGGESEKSAELADSGSEMHHHVKTHEPVKASVRGPRTRKGPVCENPLKLVR
jgi:hypothetical protein